MPHEELIGRPNQELEGIVTTDIAKAKIKTHDDFGLSMDPLHWAKPNCKKCLGRGVYVMTKMVKASEMVKGATGDNSVRATDPCECSIKRYWKVRGPLQEKVLSVWNHPGLEETKRVEACRAVIEEGLKQVRNSGTITNVKAMVKAAQDSVASGLVKPSDAAIQQILRTPKFTRKEKR